MTTSFPVANPFDVVRATPLPDVYGGDLTIGASLAEWVSGEITVSDIATTVTNDKHAYLPLVPLNYNRWAALRALQGSTSEFENAAVYDSVHLGQMFAALIPLGILTTDADRYRQVYEQFGRLPWFDMAAAASASQRERAVYDIIGTDDDDIERNLDSFVLSQMGPGYHFACLPSDGDSVRRLVTVDLRNGDKIICVCWIWYNK